MRNSKLCYYIKNVLRTWYPRIFFRSRLAKILNTTQSVKYVAYIQDRVEYYNKVGMFDVTLKDDITGYFPITNKNFCLNEQVEASVYYYDLYWYLVYFDPNLLFHYWPGDKIISPSLPNIVKSRPVAGNQNSVLMNLDRVRHFNFIKDPFSYDDKKDMAVWRGASWQPHRVTMLAHTHGHPLCDVGSNKPVENNPYKVDFMSIRDQLKYKFILCPEGNDVATNLKWVMSSNSVAMMAKPRYETWFMEGRLEAGVHYIEVKDDYSNVPEKIAYYLQHPEQVKTIICNANTFVQQFQDQKTEDLIALLVLQKYFRSSQQMA